MKTPSPAPNRTTTHSPRPATHRPPNRRRITPISSPLRSGCRPRTVMIANPVGCTYLPDLLGTQRAISLRGCGVLCGSLLGGGEVEKCPKSLSGFSQGREWWVRFGSAFGGSGRLCRRVWRRLRLPGLSRSQRRRVRCGVRARSVSTLWSRRMCGVGQVVVSPTCR